MLSIFKRSDGYTLIELIVSIAVLRMIVVPLSSVFTASSKTNRRAEEQEKANLIAQQIMERCRSIPLTIDDDGNVESIPDTVDGFKISAKAEEYGGEKYKLPDYQDTAEDQYDLIIKVEDNEPNDEITLYEGKSTGTVISNNVFDLPSDYSTSKLDIVVSKRNKIMVSDDSGQKCEVSIRDDSLDDNLISIKVHCTNEESVSRKLIINLTNSTNMYVKIDTVKSVKTTTNVVVNENGKNIKRSFNSVRDASHKPQDLNTLYKITVTVTKDGEEFAKLTSLKKLEVQ